MEHANIPGTSLSVSRVAIGTWAIGGWMWGGTDETESIATRSLVLRWITASMSSTPPRLTDSAALRSSSARRLPRVVCARAC